MAEFGAAFLCGIAGITSSETEQLQAGYIDGWSRVFQQDNRILLRAASAAQRAVDYIRGLNQNHLEGAQPKTLQPGAVTCSVPV